VAASAAVHPSTRLAKAFLKDFTVVVSCRC
jgi:hypothetical protein